MLFKACQTVMSGLDVTVKMLCQLSNGLAGAVEPQQTGSGSYFRGHVRVEFKVTRLEVFVFADGYSASRSSHLLILYLECNLLT